MRSLIAVVATTALLSTGCVVVDDDYDSGYTTYYEPAPNTVITY